MARVGVLEPSPRSQVVGHLDHRWRRSEWPRDPGAHPVVSVPLVRVGTGAVVRAGHGRRFARVCLLLCVEVASSEPRARTRFGKPAHSWSLVADRNRELPFMQNHILSIILFTPLLGALVLLFVPKENKDAVLWIANIFALGGFLISLPLVPMFWAERFQPGFKFIEGAPNTWIPTIGAGYYLGIDGISFLLIMLTTLLGWISILSSWTAIENRVKEYYIWFLILQTGMLGVFMALDFFLFFVFWEAMLVPMYLLIGIWGGSRKLYAAIKFFLYTFSVPELYKTAPLIYTQYGATYATLLFLSFFFAFAIKVPMFPFHTWLPDAHVEAPTAGSVILAGVLLKMGTYGFIRFSLPFFPSVVTNPKVRAWMIGLSI